MRVQLAEYKNIIEILEIAFALLIIICYYIKTTKKLYQMCISLICLDDVYR